MARRASDSAKSDRAFFLFGFCTTTAEAEPEILRNRTSRRRKASIESLDAVPRRHFAKEICRQLNIALRLISNLALYGQKTVKACAVQRRKIGVEVNAALSQRHLKIGGFSGFDAVLCMRMEDVWFQDFRSLCGVVGYTHDQVCRIEVYARAVHADIIQKSPEHSSLFRPSLNSKFSSDAFCMLRHLAAGVEHDVVGRRVVFRYRTDVGRNDTSFKCDGKFQNALKIGKLAVDLLRRIVCAPDVAAQRGNHHTV